MPSQNGETEDPVKIADLFSKVSQLAVQGEKEMARIVGTILPLLAYVDEPIGLDPASLGAGFVPFRTVSLRSGAVVVMTDSRGRVASRPLVEFATADCLAILKESFPELQRLVTDKKRADKVRPILFVKLPSAGQRFILGKRSRRLLLSNSGWDCANLSITILLSDGGRKVHRERDLAGGSKVELELGGLKELDGEESLNLRFECEDVDGRELWGEASLGLGGDSLGRVILTPKRAPTPVTA